MITTLRTDITIEEICKGFVYNELEGKGLFGLSGKLTIQPEWSVIKQKCNRCHKIKDVSHRDNHTTIRDVCVCQKKKYRDVLMQENHTLSALICRQKELRHSMM